MVLQLVFETINVQLVYSIAGIIMMLVGTSAAGASVSSLLPVAYGELLGRHNVTSAMATILFYEGLGALTATFIAGRFQSHYHSCVCIIFNDDEPSHIHFVNLIYIRM